MLRRMFGEGDDGLVDRLLTFSTPTTGSFWFCPSLDDLERTIGELPDGPD
jgi:deferrochelatase/peroxidase EfeB